MKRKKNFFKDNLILHPFITVILVILFLFSFVFLLLICLKSIDKFFYDRFINFFARLNGGVEVWFTFYGSYLGVIATVVLGLITLRLSIKIDRMNTVSQINTLNIKRINFYDFLRDYKPSVMMKSELKRRYCFEIILKKYRPNYIFIIEEIEWGVISKDNEPVSYNKLNNWKTYFEQNRQSILYIYCDDIKSEKIEDSLNFFYRLFAYEPITMQPHERKRILKISMKMDKKINKSNTNETNKAEDLIDVNMTVILENKGYKNGHILLSNLDCKIDI